MKATNPVGSLRPSRAFEQGRVCSAPGCDTQLSKYNASDRCWQHADVSFPNYRGKRLTKVSGI